MRLYRNATFERIHTRWKVAGCPSCLENKGFIYVSGNQGGSYESLQCMACDYQENILQYERFVDSFVSNYLASYCANHAQEWASFGRKPDYPSEDAAFLAEEAWLEYLKND